MNYLSRFEKIAYYPVTIAWTLMSFGSFVNSSLQTNPAIPCALLLVAIGLWYLPFSQKKSIRVLLRSIFIVITVVLLCLLIAWVPWILGGLIPPN